MGVMGVMGAMGVKHMPHRHTQRQIQTFQMGSLNFMTSKEQMRKKKAKYDEC